MKTHRLSRVATALVLGLGLSAVAQANTTSSAIKGHITDPQSNAAVGTVVTITHVPSGTSRQVTVNSVGAFAAKGLRVGGPYTVIIDSDTFSDTTLDNIFLSLGDTHRISQQLQDVNIERIQVTGSQFLQTSGGSNSVFGADLIKSIPESIFIYGNASGCTNVEQINSSCNL